MIKPTYTVGYLVFREVEVTNANTISGQLIYGVPQLSALLGAFHSMSRKLSKQDPLQLTDGYLDGVMVICHECDVDALRTNPYKDYTFNQSKSVPNNKTDYSKFSNESAPSIIEEGRCRIVMSFVVEVRASGEFSNEQKDLLRKQAARVLQTQPLAGGQVTHFSDIDNRILFVESEDLEDIAFSLPSGYALMDASEELTSIVEDKADDSYTALDALIDVCSIHFTPTINDDNETEWSMHKIGHPNQLSPIAIGFQGISQLYEAGEMQECRKPNNKSQYVETIYGLGKWVLPHVLRLDDELKNAFWRYDYQAKSNLYLISQNTN